MANTKPIPGKRDKDLDAPDLIERYWDKFWKAHPTDFARHSEEAVDWFRVRVSKDLRVQARHIIQEQSDYRKLTKADRTMIGKLYLYEYEAEEAGDADTGFYDRYPMVFFFNVVKNNAGNTLLYGINMHYLTPKQRAVLYMGLMKLKTSKKWSPNTKLRLQWNLIKSVANHKLAEKAVHAYRLDRMQSKLVEIPSNDWIIAVFLRLEKWLQAKGTDHPLPSEARRKVQNKKMLAKK